MTGDVPSLAGLASPSEANTESVALQVRQHPETVTRSISPRRAAVVVVDAWDRHWCSDFTRRQGEITVRMDAVIRRLRHRGFTIIWAPAATNRLTPTDDAARALTASVPNYDMPPIGRVGITDNYITGKTAITCVTGEKPTMFKKYLNENLSTVPGDYCVSTGQELWNILRNDEIDTALYMGFAANNCIKARSYGMLEMKKRGIRTFVVRDLTDLDYTVIEPPELPAEATDGWFRHVEPQIGPTVTSAELLEKF